MTSAFLIPAFTAAVLGGMTSLPGAFLGGVIVGVVAVGRHQRRRSSRTSRASPGTLLIVFIVLLVVLVVRPQGLLGKSA